MSIGYRAVQWSRSKRVYDLIAAGAAASFIVVFIAVGKAAWRGEHAVSDEVLFLRATGACALALLHVVLCIGPLARFDSRFLPVLFNRRHLGVLTFLVALAHGVVAIGYYHGFGSANPLLSLLTSNTNFGSLGAFPFQLLGAGGLLILFLLAATSHDFWLKNLSARVWKSLHMLVYAAYAMLVGHVALGAMQTDRGVLLPALVIGGAAIVCGLHIAAGLRESARDRADARVRGDDGEEWFDVGPAMEIPLDRARTVCTPRGDRIAVFRHDGGVSAVTNRCAHQGGPLGEGAVIDGCITCPWHGWQYRAHDGCAPPPFAEKIATYQVRIVAGRAHVSSRALPPGSPVPPARIEEHADVRAD
ncbi:MAG: ferric reductase-like transmembrane domain-containing protein [Phycisphaeraceae bacterium]|nr:ferric reductase-like transmembrane domain-containing protein [Phycisphaeraceae bacterium]